jgi:hypothetical protein
MRLALILPSLSLSLVLAACGSTTVSEPLLKDGGPGDSNIVSCQIDPKGMFTFHVHNAGTETLAWDLGCSKSLPIVLHLPDGDLPTGPGAVDVCEFTCELVYSGQVAPGGCTDCGPGYSGSAAPGASKDIVWDRRVYTRSTVDPTCGASGGVSQSATCALGHAVAPSATQSGTISVCPGTAVLGHCMANGQYIDFHKVEFTVDTTGTDAVIDVQ